MFLSKISAADDRSPFGDFWFEPLSMRTMSGARVSSDTAIQLSAVFRAISLVSGHIAMLPLQLKKAGTRQKIEQHPLYKLFKKPNRWQNGLEWRQMLQGHLMLRGVAFNEIIDNARGEITELIPLHPDRTKIELLPNGDWRYRVTSVDGTERTLARGQVWKLCGLSSNGITGLSVIECARESIGLGLSAQSYGARFFANDAKPAAGWIEVPGKFADKAARINFRESVQEAQSSANRGKMMVLDQNMKYHEVGLNNRDSQFLESRKFQISEIARWFGVPPHKLADLDRATNNNIEQQALEYISDSLMLWAEIWEAGIESELLFDNEEIEVEFDFAKLLRADSSTRYKNHREGIAAGWLTRNEARVDEGRQPLPGLDEPLRPLNMVEESEAEDIAGDTEAAELPSQEKKEQKPLQEDVEDESESARRLKAMVESNASRLARRIVKAYPLGQADVEVIAEGLAIPLEAAEYWSKHAPFTSETFTVENIAESLVKLWSQT